MSSRRDSRVHIAARQNDALMEFENFKKKYLLVNRHITKLNSTLSVRVEELNAQVSTLYVENLRLRASEISLAAQLKREKERSHRVVEQAEKVVGILMEQLTGMRASLNLPTPEAAPTGGSSPLKRKLPTSPVQPPRETVRLARPPADVITLIRESEEDNTDIDSTPTRSAPSQRSSTSRLPLPKLSTPIPHTEPPPDIDLAGSAKRKIGRRNSSLLVIDHGSVIPIDQLRSPPGGSSRITRRKSLETRRTSLEEEEEVELAIRSDADDEPDRIAAPSPLSPVSGEHIDMVQKNPAVSSSSLPNGGLNFEPKGKSRLPVGIKSHEIENQSASERESSESSSKERDRRRFGIKDVTNSLRTGLPDLVDETKLGLPLPLVLNSTTPSLLSDDKFTSATATSSSAISIAASDAGSEAADNGGGRERRTRKSVNYAEPKLNTKMRKPDPPPEVVKSRASTGTARRRKSIPASMTLPASDEDGDADVEGVSTARSAGNRRKTVHDAGVSRLSPPIFTQEGSTAAKAGTWGDEVRRHSMAS